MENQRCFVTFFNNFMMNQKSNVMKKKSIQKLSLKKASVSKLNANAVKGGTGLSQVVCESQDFCVTIDYTRCRGEYNCQIYPYPTDQNF
ncbi:hypothetical protein KAOT1_12732 [Kordia algicida OT-1]|uniref:Uncharacterized protein n=2 Tax=Kordia TaxID=221065 RepID=A9DJE0_9FLAO|nr:hypothetical protein KAOT1_12732 [Kordia algicida OT-1]